MILGEKLGDKFAMTVCKPGVAGSHHEVSRKYLPLYVAEFQFRYGANWQTPNMGVGVVDEGVAPLLPVLVVLPIALMTRDIGVGALAERDGLGGLQLLAQPGSFAGIVRINAAVPQRAHRGGLFPGRRQRDIGEGTKPEHPGLAVHLVSPQPALGAAGLDLEVEAPAVAQAPRLGFTAHTQRA